MNVIACRPDYGMGNLLYGRRVPNEADGEKGIEGASDGGDQETLVGIIVQTPIPAGRPNRGEEGEAERRGCQGEQDELSE